MTLNEAYEMVMEFHRCFGAPYRDTPTLLDPQRVVNRANWMQEEVDEFRAAETLPQQADAMIDLIYFALGSLVEMGVKPAELFRIVHEANMTKLWPDGQPHYGVDGKVIKHHGWKDPDPRLRKELEEQSQRSKCAALAEEQLNKHSKPDDKRAMLV